MPCNLWVGGVKYLRFAHECCYNSNDIVWLILY